MKWRPVVIEGIQQSAIESDCKTWRISKAIVGDITRYALHQHQGEASHYADDAETLKQIAERYLSLTKR